MVEWIGSQACDLYLAAGIHINAKAGRGRSLGKKPAPGDYPVRPQPQHAIDDAQPKRSNALAIRPRAARHGYAGGTVMLRQSSTDATARTGRDFGYCSMCPKLSLRLYTAPMLDP
jgi:hypothetical protein